MAEGKNNEDASQRESIFTGKANVNREKNGYYRKIYQLIQRIISQIAICWKKSLSQAGYIIPAMEPTRVCLYL
jgi:hypothetical protein